MSSIFTREAVSLTDFSPVIVVAKDSLTDFLTNEVSYLTNFQNVYFRDYSINDESGLLTVSVATYDSEGYEQEWHEEVFAFTPSLINYAL